MTGDA